MSDHPMIYGAMARAMAGIQAVGKKKKNQQQGFMYRGIDDVMNALNPVLSRCKLFLVPEVLEHNREERQTKTGANLIYSIIKMRYTVYAEDGSSVSAVVIGEGMDSADKSSNKAMSVAMKYAMFQLFCIPTEDMAHDDPDRESPGESKPLMRTPAPASYAEKTDRVPPVVKEPPVEAAKPSGINRRQMMNDVIEKLKLDGDADFIRKLTKLKQDGLVMDKVSKDMTDIEFADAMGIMLSHYGAAA